MVSEAVKAWATNRGFVIARHVFRKRGDRSEVHLRLDELASLMTAAVEIGADEAIRLMSGELLRAAETKVQ
jgi:hypothetical protein